MKQIEIINKSIEDIDTFASNLVNDNPDNEIIMQLIKSLDYYVANYDFTMELSKYFDQEIYKENMKINSSD